MSDQSYIWHVALGVGQGTQETRQHLSDADLVRISEHLERALTAGSDPVPDHARYAMAAQTIAGALLCTVGCVADQAGVATFSVVRKSSQAAKAWKALHAGYPQYAGSLGDIPRVPYCAVRAEMGLMLHRDAGAWLDGYQIAVAWAWILKERS